MEPARRATPKSMMKRAPRTVKHLISPFIYFDLFIDSEDKLRTKDGDNNSIKKEVKLVE